MPRLFSGNKLVKVKKWMNEKLPFYSAILLLGIYPKEMKTGY